MSGQTVVKGNIGINDDTLALIQRQYVYDAGTLSWVPETQASGGGGSNTEYTEDAASAANPVGVMGIFVRSDTPSTQVSTDGDNIAQRGTNYGASYVTLLDSGGNTVSVGGGTQYTEDAVAAANPIGNVPILVRTDTPATQVSTDGDNIAQRGTNYGAAYVTLLDTGGSPVSVGGGTQYTEDAAAAANPIGTALLAVRDDARSGSLVSTDGDNIILRANNFGELYVKHTDALAVTVASIPSHAVTNAGTFAVQATIASGATSIAKAEDVASADGDVGVPAIAIQKATPSDTAGTDGDYAMLQMSAGRLWTFASLDKISGSTPDTNSGNKGGGTLRVVLATDQPALTNKLLVTPDSVALPANQSVNVAQLAGTTTTTNSGNVGIGTLRVVLATDQPALTNKLLVTPDSVALPANQSVNMAQLAGTTTTTNSGVVGIGTLRVVLATDQPQLTNKLLVTPDANSAVNISQINGVTPLMGAGNTGTGSHRVTLATDQAAIASWGLGATGTTVPTGGHYIALDGQTALPTAVATGQLAGMFGDVFGRPVVHLGTVRDLRATQATTISSTTETTIITAGAAGVKNDLVMVIINNTSATAVRVDIRDTTGGTVIAPIYVPAGQPVGFGIPGSPIPQTSAAGNWTIQLASAVTDIRTFCLFEKNK